MGTLARWLHRYCGCYRALVLGLSWSIQQSKRHRTASHQEAEVESDAEVRSVEHQALMSRLPRDTNSTGRMMEALAKYEQSLTLDDRILLCGLKIECGVDRLMGWNDAAGPQVEPKGEGGSKR